MTSIQKSRFGNQTHVRACLAVVTKITNLHGPHFRFYMGLRKILEVLVDQRVRSMLLSLNKTSQNAAQHDWSTWISMPRGNNTFSPKKKGRYFTV